MLKNTMDPYRAPRLPEELPPPPRELVYFANDRDHNRGALVGSFTLVVGPILLGALLYSLVGVTSGIVGLAGGIAAAVWARKTKATREGSLLRIDGEDLRIFSADGRIEKAAFSLQELAGVELDVKTIERLQEATGPIPALRFANATVAPAVDTARVVLVGTRGRRYTMSEAYLAHMDVTESVGKIRVFLRKNGWLPVGERKKKRRKKSAGSAEPSASSVGEESTRR